MRIVYYLNQFFGGRGGEEAAHLAPHIQDGAVGPGRLLEQVLGAGAQVVRTIVVGDNYAAEHVESLSALAVQEVQQCQADLFVAGPCFEAGRYGMAAGALCKAVKAALGVPVITAMAVENPGVDMYRSDIYIVDSGAQVQAMRDVLSTMVRLAWKLMNNQAIGRPGEEGYIPQGILRDDFVEPSAAERLGAMVYAKYSSSGLRIQNHHAARAGAVAITLATD